MSEQELSRLTPSTSEQQILATAEQRGPWVLVYRGWSPAQEGHREALCTTGNGYFATRGAAPEARADGIHYPGTYVAGTFNRLRTEIAGREVKDESIVNVPNWLPLGFRLEDGPWFEVAAVELLDYEQELDLRRGLLTRTVRFRDRAGRRTRVVQRRFVSMARAHLGALEIEIEPEDWSGRVEVRSALDGTVRNSGVARYEGLANLHLDVEGTTEIDAETIGLEARTTQSRIVIAEAATTRVRAGRATERWLAESEGGIAHHIVLEVRRGEPAVVEKIAAIHTSRDPAISEPGEAARLTLAAAADFERLLAEHVTRWAHLWERAGIELDEGERTRFALNAHIFHMLQVISEHTAGLDVSVPARGLHGEAYRGHIFWDELFLFPYLSFRFPGLAKSLLRYRHRRLPAARRAAAAAGLRGAMFPWQSGSDGREETPLIHLNPKSGRWVPDNSRRQYHISAAVAYNVIHHYRVTRDLDFIAFRGAEIVLEVARFWGSIAELDAETGRYVIRGAMGPDEYHDAYPGADRPGLDNNAYTNVTAVWVLCRALELLEHLPRARAAALIERIELSTAELDRWREISERMTVPFHGDGIISQFEGYDGLEEFDWAGYRDRYGDIQRLDRILEAEGDTTNRYKASKQPDALMLLFLFTPDELRSLFDRLGYTLGPGAIARNIDYYSRRTSHGSTLSRVVGSWVLARADRAASWALFREALESDLSDIQGGTTAEGIHLGAMAGTVDLIQRGYTGIEPREDALAFAPVLPEDLRGMSFSIHYRDHWDVGVRIDRDSISITLPESDLDPPITVEVGDQRVRVAPGETRVFGLAVHA
ncbi:MAG TPA: glycosyl hydrolase family 65 protein [Solirubrobacterales bacterium]|nr:glycosyl hydrolase family 65 protein [Solirubrobacterales bacterium]